VSAAVTIAALPVAYLVLRGLLATPLPDRLVAQPTGERWHERATPIVGGIGIAAGFLAGVALALAVGALEPSRELNGIVAGCVLLFLVGLVDDVRALSPFAKLGAQIAAAAIAVAAGLRVELVENDVAATAVALVWLVGITNAFNLLDNMDGLAASLATVACGYFAVAAATEEAGGDLVVVLALALGLACLGFLPLNLRRGGAAVFMGDSGSQLLGFALACLALASSWTAAGTTVAAVLLPLLVLAVPILDTALVTAVRVLERRPVTQGGRDHTSHRLVYYGLSERKAVLLLTLVAVAIGATGIAYNVLDDGRVTVVGVLVTVVLLVQFASFLSDLEERARAGRSTEAPSLVRALLEPRRLAEVLIDFGLMCASFLAAYVLVVGDLGTNEQRAVFLAALPVVLAIRYVCFVVAGVYRRVWRFVSGRDAAVIALACVVSAAGAALVVDLSRGTLGSFPGRVFVLDAVLATLLACGARLTARLVLEARDDARAAGRRRVLLVGAGRSGRGLAHELRETPGTTVVGFVDDNPGVRRRRVAGVSVLGGLDELPGLVGSRRIDEVLVTIPDAPPERLAAVVDACRTAGVECRFVRRETGAAPPSLLEARAR
jgi:UDP-GlcNAc:undecaprenyl-phosphate GlcNAc-1-phosphate transferase